ncbi:MAG: cation diffusion facilitator family transporter [Bacteroidota bacterium]|nr:cation diffusion facilitator family transporter [Bacteroidota bacterium]
MTKKKSYKKAMFAGWLAIIGNVFLFALKLWAGIVSGSVALMADAWHTLSDSVSSIVLLVFYKFANKPPDMTHPYGHGRFRLIASVIIGVILFLVGLNFGVEAVGKLIAKESAEFGTLALVAMIVSVLVKEGMARYALHAYKKLDSLALKADAWHHRSDAISSLVILAGIVLQKYAWWIDGALGMVVSVLIVYTAWEIVQKTIDVILGKKPDGKLIKEVRNIVNETVGFDVLSHHFHLHTYGDHKELTFHVVLPGDWTLDKVNVCIREMRKLIREKLDVEPTIQVDAK